MGGKVRSMRRLCASALGAAVLTACGSTAQPGNSVGGGGVEQLSGSANLDVPGSSNPESPGTVAAGQAGSSQPLNAGAGVAASLPITLRAQERAPARDVPPSDRLQIALIGAGGQGMSDTRSALHAAGTKLCLQVPHGVGKLREDQDFLVGVLSRQ